MLTRLARWQAAYDPALLGVPHAVREGMLRALALQRVAVATSAERAAVAVTVAQPEARAAAGWQPLLPAGTAAAGEGCAPLGKRNEVAATQALRAAAMRELDMLRALGYLDSAPPSLSCVPPPGALESAAVVVRGARVGGSRARTAAEAAARAQSGRRGGRQSGAAPRAARGEPRRALLISSQRAVGGKSHGDGVISVFDMVILLYHQFQIAPYADVAPWATQLFAVTWKRGVVTRDAAWIGGASVFAGTGAPRAPEVFRQVSQKAMFIRLWAQPRWVSCAPFGRPVVPLV